MFFLADFNPLNQNLNHPHSARIKRRRAGTQLNKAGGVEQGILNVVRNLEAAIALSLSAENDMNKLKKKKLHMLVKDSRLQVQERMKQEKKLLPSPNKS